MGLNFLIPDTRKRRSRLWRERSSASAGAICSRSVWGDQRPRMARAKKSFRLAGNERKPICWSRCGRLFVGVFVVTGEFIVSLQVMWLDINELRLRMATEVNRRKRRGGSLLSLPQQKGNRRG